MSSRDKPSRLVTMVTVSASSTLQMWQRKFTQQRQAGCVNSLYCDQTLSLDLQIKSTSFNGVIHSKSKAKNKHNDSRRTCATDGKLSSAINSTQNHFQIRKDSYSIKVSGMGGIVPIVGVRIEREMAKTV